MTRVSGEPRIPQPPSQRAAPRGRRVDESPVAPQSPGNAASLAAVVLAEEASRQEAQARAREQIIFPDDLLPGVNSEPVSFGGVEMHRPGTIIGKALESLEKGTGEILVLLSLQ